MCLTVGGHHLPLAPLPSNRTLLPFTMLKGHIKSPCSRLPMTRITPHLQMFPQNPFQILLISLFRGEGQSYTTEECPSLSRRDGPSFQRPTFTFNPLPHGNVALHCLSHLAWIPLILKTLWILPVVKQRQIFPL